MNRKPTNFGQIISSHFYIVEWDWLHTPVRLRKITQPSASDPPLHHSKSQNLWKKHSIIESYVHQSTHSGQAARPRARSMYSAPQYLKPQSSHTQIVTSQFTTPTAIINGRKSDLKVKAPPPGYHFSRFIDQLRELHTIYHIHIKLHQPWLKPNEAWSDTWNHLTNTHTVTQFRI